MKRAYLCLSFISTLLIAAPVYAEDKPHKILFLAIDDLNTWLLSEPHRYGGKVAAPNFHKLVDEGVFR